MARDRKSGYPRKKGKVYRMICWYVVIGFVTALIIFVVLIIEESSGYRDLDFGDFLTLASLGILTGLAWPVTVPLFTMAGIGYFVWHIITKE